jgi:hypothetical protein
MNDTDSRIGIATVPPRSQRAAIEAATLIAQRWDVVPMNDGGVQLELHTHECDIEFEISPDGRVVDAYVKIGEMTLERSK